MEQRRKLIVMMEIAMMAALAMGIDYLDSGFRMGPYSFSFSMVPILILGVRRGVMAAATGGLVWSLLQIILGDAAASAVNPVQLILDYPIAFTMLGISGLAMNKGRNMMIAYITLAIVVRYIFHFISGWVFFGIYAPKGQPAWLYSLIVNGGTMIPNLIVCVLIMVLITVFAKKILVVKEI